MQFESTQIQGVVVIRPEQFADERGYFVRTWGQDVFEARGLNPRVVQRNLSFNASSGTLRGMHFQRAPYAEVKLVSCVAGSIYDVAIDLRPESASFGSWVGCELQASTGTMLYIPEGCAHGYLTLEPDTSVEYLLSEFYRPECADGVRWNDPFFAIRWPIEPSIMNARDGSWPDFQPSTVGTGV
jgi:dTDP-4-dehydrorhamnose 3,5-epimerase